jgi:hypothetical protein
MVALNSTHACTELCSIYFFSESDSPVERLKNTGEHSLGVGMKMKMQYSFSPLISMHHHCVQFKYCVHRKY